MNLGQYIAQQLLEAERPTIALFPGAFKPPHKGHFDVVKQLLQRADQVVILISPKTREGVTADESVAVWNLYKTKLDGAVELKISEMSPVKETYDVVKENPNTNFLVAFGKGEMDRYKTIDKFPNVTIFDAGEIEGVNATGLRMALLKDDNNEEIKGYLPEDITVEEFMAALGKPAEPAPAPVAPAEPVPAAPAPEAPLQESPPLEFEQDDYQDYVLQNRNKIEKASYVFNLPINDMEYAFDAGREVVLNDDMWSKLENSKSYKMKTLDDAIQHSLKLGINPKPYIDFIKAGKEMPLPLVLCYAQDKYYLVGGEVVLSLYRALGSIPSVIQGTLNLKTNVPVEYPVVVKEGLDKKIDSNIIKEFIKFAIKELGITRKPEGLTLSYNTDTARSRHTFGTFDPNDGKIWLYVKNRNMADILRTLAHELVHRKQDEDGRIDYTSGNTGSEIENEANAQAGILLRKFGKNNENIYENKK